MEEDCPLSDLVAMLEGHSDNGIERVELRVPNVGRFSVSHIEVYRDRVVIVAERA